MNQCFLAWLAGCEETTPELVGDIKLRGFIVPYRVVESRPSCRALPVRCAADDTMRTSRIYSYLSWSQMERMPGLRSVQM